MEEDKSKVPPHSICESHYKDNPELNARFALDKLPQGSVLALKLPQDADRKYAYLICNTSYQPNQSLSAITSMMDLEMCLNTAWKVVALLHPNGHRICLPFLGKGYSGLTEYSYGILWTIVYSYRKAATLAGLYNYGINICLPVSILTRNNLQIRATARFLTHALRG